MSDSLIYPWDAVTKVALPPRVPQLDRRASKKAGQPVYMLTPNATDEAPPEANDGYAVRRIDGAWVLEESHTGKAVYDKATGAERKIRSDEFGAIPGDVTTTKPGPFDKWDKKRGRWAEDTGLKAERNLEARRAEAQEAARQRVANVAASDVSATDIAIVLGLRELPVSE